MLKIALTGGLACGKSLVGSILRDRGICVCESDQLAHAVILPGQPAYAQVVAAFGRSILNPDGTICRPRLGDMVFQDEAARARLNALVHPRVRELWEGWLRAQAEGGAELVVVVIPLLFEVGLERGWDAIVCVRSPPELQRERLRGRGLDDARIDQRLGAQWPTDEKARRSDYIIENDGSATELEARTLEVVRRIRESKYG
jgi:dephospho-CoA kinase